MPSVPPAASVAGAGQQKRLAGEVRARSTVERNVDAVHLAVVDVVEVELHLVIIANAQFFKQQAGLNIGVMLIFATAVFRRIAFQRFVRIA